MHLDDRKCHISVISHPIQTKLICILKFPHMLLHLEQVKILSLVEILTILFIFKINPPFAHDELNTWLQIIFLVLDQAGLQKMCILKVVEAFCVNLWHTSYLGVSRDAASKSAVCQDEKALQMPQTGEIKDGRFHWNKHFNIHIFFLLKMIETWKKTYIYMFIDMGNPLPNVLQR